MKERFVRRAGWVFFVIFNVLFLSGCTTAPIYTPADEQGPPADFTGGWIGEGGSHMLVFQQTGTRVTGIWYDMAAEGPALRVSEYPRASSWSVEGEIKGRVLHGRLAGSAKGCRIRWPSGRVVDDFSFDLALAPGGESGQCQYLLSYFLSSTAAVEKTYRIILGPATNLITCVPGTDLGWLRGGIICQLPVANDGQSRVMLGPDEASLARLGTAAAHYQKFPSFQVRKVFVTSQFESTNGVITPSLITIPLDEPRSPVAIYDSLPFFIHNAIRPEDVGRVRSRSGVIIKQSFVVDGVTYWGQMVPLWPYARGGVVQTGLTPSSVRIEVYQKDPDLGGWPIELQDLTWRDDRGAWIQHDVIPHWCKSYTALRPTLRQGQPVGFEVITTNEPPLEMFLDPVLVPSADVLKLSRWRTGILLQAKNSTLPRLLKEGSNDRLQHLVTKGEKAVLDYALQADLAKNRAQEALEKGGSPTRDREWSLVYNERLAVLSAIVAAIKEELANRSR